ncbi:hypothetical protein ACTTAI_10195 [Rhodobacter capsulatus]|uniref:hypothetical protein n=1 Tax=Rhodobacter capsulatus TaxID=1061 RepID=UPI00402744E1
MEEPTPKDQTQQEAAANPAAPTKPAADLALKEAAEKEAAAKEAKAKDAAAQDAAKAAAKEAAAKPKSAAPPKSESGAKPAAEPVLEKVTKTSETDVAFALGGLAGNNAHGAGFLQAALEGGVHPRAISCTSGQIYWVYLYLRALEAGGDDLETQLADAIAEQQPFGQRDADLMHLAMYGKSGVFRPSFFEWPIDMMQNFSACLDSISRSRGDVFYLREMASLVPARTLVPLFDESFFERISDAFNATGIGILFNSFDPRTGTEYVHINPSAQAQIGIGPGDRKPYRSHTIYKEITPEAVRDGLWLYEYGFEGEFTAIDGVYYRPIILSELSAAKSIFVVRPVNRRWLGDLPTSKPALEDLKTEVAFNGIYHAERDRMVMVNRWIKEGVICDPRFSPIDIYEIEVETQRSFFDYIFESMEVFEDARALARTAFAGDLIPVA